MSAPPVLADGETSGGKLAVRVVGEGPAVGWIHGYTMSSRVFDSIWPLMPGFRHVGIDLPGHGDSASWSPGAKLSEIARDVAQVLEREDVRHLVAVSMGTMVAFEMVIRKMHVLDKLVVVAPGLVGMPPGSGTAELYRMLTMMRRMGLSPDQVSRTWLAAPTGIFAGLREHPAELAAMATVVACHGWDELDSGGPAAFYREPQSAGDLPGSAAELLLVTGGNDMPEFQDLAAQLASTLPTAAVAHFPNAGHLPLFEQPAATVIAIAQFLAESSASTLTPTIGRSSPTRIAAGCVCT